MPELRDLNEDMVDVLVRDGVLRSGPLERAFRAVPRHLFVPDLPPEQVHADEAIVTRTGPDGSPTSSLGQPSVVAVMLDQLGIAPGDRVLEIGTGTGYNAALLAELAGPIGQVTTVELDPDVAELARKHLAAADAGAVTVVTGDGWQGHAEQAPYDRIISTVGTWDLSPAWLEQLDVCGMLVLPLWLRAGVQLSVGFRRDRGGLSSMRVQPCGFVGLRGQGSGPRMYLPGDGWAVLMDEPADDVVPALGGLLANPTATMALPELPAEWFVSLALTSADVVQLVLDGPTGVPVLAPGLLDPLREGLAVVADGQLRAYGAVEVAEHLRELLECLDVVPLEQLHIDVLPGAPDQAMAVVRPDTLAVLRRPNVTLVVRRG